MTQDEVERMAQALQRSVADVRPQPFNGRFVDKAIHEQIIAKLDSIPADQPSALTVDSIRKAKDWLKRD